LRPGGLDRPADGCDGGHRSLLAYLRRFRGGMGLATANGSMMAAAPVAILIIYAILGILTLLLCHRARASVITRILFAPLLWLAGLRGPAVGVVIAFRFLIDWDRKYRELWLDR
ncbi:MAG: glycerol-3-phosphate acyltransferase, partial [Chloroflexi bacterium]|nr:glycerol-3-phosphate acyltransferase [Chloroflexota bacterium]